MRRLLMNLGVEVVHLGHNLSVEELVTAAVQEDVHGVAVSSYQGGHLEYFEYLVNKLRERGRGDAKVFGGGGGVIVPDEIKHLQSVGVERIYSPEDGVKLGLVGMIQDMVQRAAEAKVYENPNLETDFKKLLDSKEPISDLVLSRVITALETNSLSAEDKNALFEKAEGSSSAVVGVTGTGGAGKSSLIDELLLRFRSYNPEKRIAIIAIDPTRQKSGGALLADRVRMNSVGAPWVYMRSLATRSSKNDVPDSLPFVVAACKLAGFDMVLVETPGIGQRGAEIVELVDVALYVMTPEYGAPSQLEKISMLDYANIIAINKFDRPGSMDALRYVRKQFQRNTNSWTTPPEKMPVYGTMASNFNDPGVTALYDDLVSQFQSRNKGVSWNKSGMTSTSDHGEARTMIIPTNRKNYLSDIAKDVRDYHRHRKEQVKLVREISSLEYAKEILIQAEESVEKLDEIITEKKECVGAHVEPLFSAFEKVKKSYSETNATNVSLSGTIIPKVSLPKYEEKGQLLDWLLRENVPGVFPYTGGVFPFKRQGEDPARMFAGEGDPARTNRRFKYVSKDMPAKRLSTAFDSVTLYGVDPATPPDIYGKIGNSGVSICTVDDMGQLMDGFDLCSPTTSVSMTINGPAPTIVAFFFNTAINQQIVKFKEKTGRDPTKQEKEEIISWTLSQVRGTVQADILKEDQGQNTCIFSTEFSLRMMGDVQEYFIKKNIKNFYSVSISGYHIAEAGANPISQLAFTLANGFTYVETYLARGMKINDFAPNLSFFFSMGMDPEYAVLGRVARRIWAIAMRDRYDASPACQRLKFHLQTSGRSLHAQEYQFNDIRTTLQALIGLYQNTNSLHTNSYDEAITTPTEESVRRALAIQLIINKEWGISKNHNPNQGSFIIEELTDLVEAAVLDEFDRISQRGGVLGAMEMGYQRGKIQDESMFYEQKKNDGSLPLIGVNTFINPNESTQPLPELQRSTTEEKEGQLTRLKAFHEKNSEKAKEQLEYLKKTAREGGNVFEALMTVTQYCSLGQISQAMYEVGGKYRRNM